MVRVTYQNIGEVLLEQFPEYKSSEFYDEINKDLRYVIVGGFAPFLLHRLKEFSINDSLVQRGFKFINDIYNDKTIPIDEGTGDTVQNIIFIDFFGFIRSTDAEAVARDLFTGDARDEFDPSVVIYEGSKENLN